MGRIGMSQKELRRVEVLARVKSRELKVLDAASLVEARESDLGRPWQPSIWRAKTGCRWMRRRCGDGCWRKGCGADSANGNRIGSGESDGGTLGSWCRWT